MSESARGDCFLFVGTYTHGASQGIYSLAFNASRGKLDEPKLAAITSNPSYLALHPNGRFLYAANEDSIGTVSAFAIQPSGKLQPLNTVPSRGTHPCHIAIDQTGRHLFVANYSDGSVAMVPIAPDGSLLEATWFAQHTGASIHDRQRGPHAHQAVLSPDNRFLLVPDLGADRLVVYRFDAATGTVTSTPTGVALTPGSGPRHLVFHGDRTVYLLNELTSTVSQFHWDLRAGELRPVAEPITTLPPEFTAANTAAAIARHPNGKFLYASNRGHDSIAVFAISPTGVLHPAGHHSTLGKTPRHFSIAPTGNFLLAANQDSNTIVVFRIDETSGGLTATGESAELPAPVALVFAGRRK